MALCWRGTKTLCLVSSKKSRTALTYSLSLTPPQPFFVVGGCGGYTSQAGFPQKDRIRYPWEIWLFAFQQSALRTAACAASLAGMPLRKRDERRQRAAVERGAAGVGDLGAVEVELLPP